MVLDIARAKLILTGFDEMLEKIQRAQGKIEQAAEKGLKAGAEALTRQYEDEAKKSGASADEINALVKSPKVTKSGNIFSVDAGFKLGTYNANNPSGGYIAMFRNYGTIKRQTKAGANRGAVSAAGFIQRAEKRASSKVKKAEKQALQEILEDLK